MFTKPSGHKAWEPVSVLVPAQIVEQESHGEEAVELEAVILIQGISQVQVV